MEMRRMVLILSAVFFIALTTSANAEWHFGIGTGLSATETKGEQGVNVVTNNIGPVKWDIDPGDFVDTGFGLGGFATDGKWMIQSSFSYLELSDETLETVGVNTVRGKFNFDISNVEFTVGYPIYQNKNLVLRGYSGLRYTKHNVGAKVVVDDVTRTDRDIDEDWTDVLLGLSTSVPFATQWSWNSKFDAGFGGSEGSYCVNTGIAYNFATHWSATIYGQFRTTEYENGTEADEDWYFYDLDETSLGINISYAW